MKTLINKAHFIIILVLFLSASRIAFSQANISWVKNYSHSGQGDNTVNDMAIDGSGNIYVAGKLHDTLMYYKPGLVKYNSSGVFQWVKEVSSASGQTEEVKAIAVDYNGNIYVTGRTFAVLDGDDIFTSKLSPAGSIIWTKKYSSGDHTDDCGNDVAVDNSGNVYITGVYEQFSTPRIITIKYSPDGTQLWSKIYTANAGTGTGNALVVNGVSVYVAGTANNNGMCLKYSADGAELWVRTYNGGDIDDAKCIALDLNGNVIVAGSSILTGDMNDYFIIKYNSDGTQQWLRYYNGDNSGEDKLTDLKTDLKNNVYVTGSSVGLSNNNNYATLKFTSGGTLKWTAKYDGPNNRHDDANSLALDYQGNVYVTGSSLTITSSTDIATVKYDSTGAQQWVNTYSSSAASTDVGTRILIDNSGDIVIAGGTTVLNKMNFCTLKYSSVQGIQNTGGEIPSSYSLSQNYPNPFNPVTNIRFSIPQSGNVKIAIYDITGREVSTAVNEYLHAGSYTYDFDAIGLSSGTYFYKLTTADFSDVKKMILVK